MKKFLALILSLLFVCSASLLAACGSGNDDGWIDQIDTDKTQIYVSNLQGGIGREWLDKTIERFTAAYAEESFEEGKTGVQIVVDDYTVNGAWLQLPNHGWDVYFTENLPFNDYVAKGEILNISDIVKAPAYGETATIESKLDDAQKQGMTLFDGEYYVLPHYEAYRGIFYNRKVFESHKLFYKIGGGWAERPTDKLSAGPDGVEGTEDDGLPATIPQFMALLDRMVTMGVTPFVWTGKNVGYFDYLVDAFADAIMGAQEGLANYSIDSGANTVKIVTGFKQGEPIVENVTINNDNGYLLRQQWAKYQALKIAEKIIKNIDKYATSLSNNNSTHSQYDAQEDFYRAEFEGSPIGMLIDGSYWWREMDTQGVYSRAVGDFGPDAKAENRDMRWMPLPGVVEELAGQTPVTTPVVKDSMKSYCFINADVKQHPARMAVAKAFVSFCYTDESLQEFTTTTGVPKGLKYELTEAQYNSLTSLGKSCWDIKQNATIIRSISGSKLFMENQQDFTAYMYTSHTGKGSYNKTFDGFLAGETAEDFFKGTWKTFAEWEADYSKYFTSGL